MLAQNAKHLLKAQTQSRKDGERQFLTGALRKKLFLLAGH